MFLLKRDKKIALVVLGVLVCLNIVAWVIIWDLSKQQGLEVVFFDVGQGDSIFIETPDRCQILIDGGPSSAVLEKLAEEMPFYDRTIDLVILTHPEHDHLFGLLEVLKRYKVENILWTGVVRETAEWEEWKKLIEREGANIIIAKSDQRIICPWQKTHDRENSATGIFLDILYPFENLEGQEFKNSNDTSIVAELVFEDVSFLFTGDITKKVERELVKEGIDLELEVLKVAHHGSKTSTSQEFLEAVLPEIAVITVGENNYGHPHPEVLAILEQFDIQVLITKELGDIRIVSDGNKIYEGY